MIQDYSVPGRITNHGSGLPDADQVERLLAAAARPFVLASDRELSVLRRGLTKAGWKRTLYLQDANDNGVPLTGVGLLGRANRWLTREILIPERGGSSNDFLCDDGTRLVVTDLAPSKAAEYTCPTCGRVYSGDNYDAGRRWVDHNELANACLTLALVYQIDRDQECAEKAAEILLKYARAYPGPHTDSTTGGILHDSADEAVLVIPLAQAYDLVYHSKVLSATDRSLIEESLFRPAIEGLKAVGGTGLSGARHVSAIGAVACALRDAESLGHALRGFKEHLRNDLGDDGLWLESVHSCHFAALEGFVTLAEACSRMGISIYDYEAGPNRSLKAMFRAPVQYVYPSFDLPSINDGCGNSTIPLGLYEIAHRRWQDPVFAWVLKQGYAFSQRPINRTHIDKRSLFTRSSLNAFLFGRDLPGRVQSPKPSSTDFPSLGVGIVRSDDDSMLTFHYGSSGENGHLDQLGFTLYSHGKVRVPDYGTPCVGTADFDYYRGAYSHSTVVCDGKSQQNTAGGRLARLHSGIVFQQAEAGTTGAYPRVRHNRQIIMVGNIVLIRDVMTSDEEHVYDWLLHCADELVQAPEEVGPAADICERISDSRSRGESSNFLLRWHTDNSGLALWAASSKPGDMITALGPDATGARTVSVADLRLKAGSAEFIALLVPYQESVPVIERHGSVFKVTTDKAVDWIYVAGAPGETVGQPELKSDASLAAAREVNGNVTACGLWQGRFIELRGEELLAGSNVFDRVEVRMDSRNPVITFNGSVGDNLRLKCHSRAMRVNGHRISAACFDGTASIRIAGILTEAAPES